MPLLRRKAAGDENEPPDASLPNKNQNDVMTDSAAGKASKPHKMLGREFMILLLIMGITVLITSRFLLFPTDGDRIFNNTVRNRTHTTEPVGSYQVSVNFPETTAKYANCTLPLPPRHTTQTALHPLLQPGYPSSTGFEGVKDAVILKPLIAMLTGIQAGYKNYHASSRKTKLKRCHSPNDVAVACNTIHPMVDIDPLRFQSIFQPTILFSLRNIVTAHPLFLSRKKNQYRHEPGPLNHTEWTQHSRSHILEAFETWKQMILTWKSLEYYQIGAYVPYELLLDHRSGIKVVYYLVLALQNAGFPIVTTDEEELECIWYHAVYRADAAEKQYLNGTIFGYTRAQQQELTRAMTQFAQEQQEQDPQLAEILFLYRNHIRDFLTIDEEGNDG